MAALILRGGDISSGFFNVSNEEILENMRNQKVCAVRRITIRKDGQVLNIKHLILTFSTPDLPVCKNGISPLSSSRIHSQSATLLQRCGEVGHDSNDCSKKERCVNCKEARRVVSSRTPAPGVSYASLAKKTTQANFTQTCAEHFKELEEKNSPPPTKNSPPSTKNSPPSTKKSSPSTTNSPPPAKKK
ncbi:uncharacterized protein TNCV_2126171 [Trichonephila clavipes]|nr:uncharacterized protein TNCV_2126171 [Trichonephila clavipes]